MAGVWAVASADFRSDQWRCGADYRLSLRDGLATPTSIMVGTGRGAEMGVLFRKGEALQLLKDAKVVAVDKTGTLTEGRPVLTDLDVASGFERREVLAKVAAVESRSEHPIARAIVVSAEEEGIALRA